ncbi:hypothetical protein BWD10_02580 [Neisseria zoodegmatis]|uniref:Uncharacterized protein n=1 Tax=Neisseria zoodegmatis TaxID=326523 RepID=A0ABX3WHC6_9NEIS|nr:hypothetical protein BWD10_02580 [Neisseria zoodegmatis]
MMFMGLNGFDLKGRPSENVFSDGLYIILITIPSYSGLTRVSRVPATLGDTRVKPEYDERTIFKLIHYD